MLWIAVVQIFIGFLCCIDECVVIFLVTVICVIGLLHLSWKLPPVVCSLLFYWLHRCSSSVGNSLGHGGYLGFSFLCCCTAFLNWLGSCSWMLLAGVVLHCQVPHSLETTYHPSSAEDLLQDQHPRNLFLSIAVLSHCRMLWSHSIWWLFLHFV